MQHYHQKESIQICKQMIKAFFIDKNVDRVLSYINPKNFTWIGPGENDILTNIDDIKNYFKDHCEIVTEAYKIVSEKYSIGVSSCDSCIVIAEIMFKGIKERQNYRSSLHFSFYVQLVNDKLLISHYHVHIPIKKALFDNSMQFMINKSVKNQSELIKMDLPYQSSLLHNFYDTKHMPMKSFCYEEGLPYCYVNPLFVNLVGYKELNEFIKQENFSSLAHIHPDDQEKYLKKLKECFPEMLTLNVSQEWQWHASYYITYRTRTFNNEGSEVFEWGNLFTLNGHPIVNSFVLPLKKSPATSPIFLSNTPASTMGSPDTALSNQQHLSTIFDDCGVYIGNMIVIYPKYHKLLIKENLIDLTPIEFKLMLMLVKNINNPIDSEKIYNDLWNDPELKVTSFTLKTHISNLRHKLKQASDGLINIVHAKNKGYFLSIPQF